MIGKSGGPSTGTFTYIIPRAFRDAFRHRPSRSSSNNDLRYEPASLDWPVAALLSTDIVDSTTASLGARNFFGRCERDGEKGRALRQSLLSARGSAPALDVIAASKAMSDARCRVIRCLGASGGWPRGHVRVGVLDFARNQSSDGARDCFVGRP
jgi:hypothetical protein